MIMVPSQQTYLVVGAGVFGASTALHLRRSYPSAKVQLLDRSPFPNPCAASHDVGKIVRSAYDALPYFKLGREAMRHWQTDPIYAPWYHEQGLLMVDDGGHARGGWENCHRFAPDEEAEMLSVKDVLGRTPLLEKTSFDGVDKMLWTPYSGWVEAEPALRSAIQAGIDIGVEYIVAAISKLTFDHSGACSGAETADGRTFSAHKTILCTGAYTAKLLADSAPHRPEIQANGKVGAAGAITCTIKIPSDQRSKFRSTPAWINTLPQVTGDYVGPTAQGKLKFNCQIAFYNKEYHEASNTTISVPPTQEGPCLWTKDVPVGLKKDILKAAKAGFGRSIEGFEIESYRMCWDASTPTQSWLITPHTSCPNLYLATGGSFHAWKFFPILGAYVVQMLQGALSPELAKMWAWDRVAENAALNGAYVPLRDLKDVEGYREWVEGRGGEGDGDGDGDGGRRGEGGGGKEEGDAKCVWRLEVGDT